MPTQATNATQTHIAAQKHQAAKPAEQQPMALMQESDFGTLQRTVADPRLARPSDVLALQRTVGNQVVAHLLGHASSSPRLQFKLSVGPAGDQYEQEAGSDIEQRLAAHKGNGSLLPSEVRDFMEPRFGADFGGVRVHTGSEAAQLNRSLNAQAFTHGQDIYLGEGKSDLKSSQGKRLIAHELTHVVQQTGTIRRWAEQEHLAFGDLAARKAAQRDWTFVAGGETVKPVGVGEKGTSELTGSEEEKQQYQEFLSKQVDPLKGKLMGAMGGREAFAEEGIGVVHTQDKQRRFMTFGEATMLGGDYFKVAEGTGIGKTAGLAQAHSINPFDMQGRMKYVAATNTNHFFPLAGLEWKTQYAEAMAHAAKAKISYQLGQKSKGDNETEIAMRYLGVALHFLQDTFASGHQYPRALDDIDSLTAAGIAVEGGTVAKTYHDALCALPNGMPMQYGRRFHGDTTADASDFPVVEESYKAIAHLLHELTDKPLPDDAQEAPKHNPGPDVGKIMADREAGPIWTSMVSSIQGKLSKAKSKAEKHWYNKLRQTNFTTSAGTGHDAKYMMDEWGKLAQVKGEPSSKTERLVHAAMQSQATLLHSLGRGTSMTGIGTSTNVTADVEIRNIIKDGVPRLTHNQTVMVLGVLITGICSRADESAVLKILEAQTDDVVLSVVKEITPERIDKGLDFSAWDAFLALWASRGTSGNNPGADYIIKEKNTQAVRMLVNRLSANGQMGRLSHKQWNSLAGILGGFSLLHAGENKEAINKIALYFGLPPQPAGKKK